MDIKNTHTPQVAVNPPESVKTTQATPPKNAPKPMPAQASDSLNVSSKKGVIPSTDIFSKPAFDPIEAGKANSTKGYSKANMPVSIKEALAATMKIVEAVDPEMAKAINALDEDDFILADDGLKDMFAKHDIYAAWVAVAREGGTANLHFSDMVLDDRFWELRDAEKASVLIHEMVHAQDIPILSHFEKLFGTIKNKIEGVEWGDPVEDRAYKYQFALFDKLGIDSKDEIFWTAQTYLEDRKMVEPYKF